MSTQTQVPGQMHYPNQQSGGNGNGGAAGAQRGNANVGPTTFPVTYEGFLLRKAQPAPGERADWSRSKAQPYSVSPRDFAMEKRGKEQLSVVKAYSALKADSQREAIDRILEEQRRLEPQANATWDIALIKENREQIPGTSWPAVATRTASIQLILKRQPRAVALPKPIALNCREKTIDVNELPVYPQPVQSMAPLPMPVNNNSSAGRAPLPPLVEDLPPPPGLPTKAPNAQRVPPGPTKAPAPPTNLPAPPTRAPVVPMHQALPPTKAPPLPGVVPLPQVPLPQVRPQQPPQVIPINYQDKRPKTSNHPVHPGRGSMEFNEKVHKWDVQQGYAETETSDSDSDSDIFERPHDNRKPVKIPAPPPGAQYVPQRHVPKRSHSQSPPILKRRTSKTEIRTSHKGDREKIERKTTEKYRPRSVSSSDSDGSWDKVDDMSFRSHRSYRTDPTEYGSEYSDQYRRKSHHSKKHREQSPYRMHRQESYREHRKPAPYEGLGYASRSDRDSDSDRERRNQPIINLHFNSDGKVQQQKRLTSSAHPPPSPTSTNASLYNSSYAVKPKALPYPVAEDDVFYNMGQVQRALPPAAPMAPTYNTRADSDMHQQEFAAAEYIRSQVKRETHQMLDMYKKGMQDATDAADARRYEKETSRRYTDFDFEEQRRWEQERHERDMEKRLSDLKKERNRLSRREQEDRERDYVHVGKEYTPRGYETYRRDSFLDNYGKRTSAPRYERSEYDVNIRRGFR